ncbi:MAG TPA: hypothetical protein VI636_12180 [Candidatus Angelobacter sp.]
MPSDKDEAGNEAHDVAGVVGVTNNIAVTGPQPPPQTSGSEAAASSVSQPPPASPITPETKKSTKSSRPADAATAQKVSGLVKRGNQQRDDGNYVAAIATFQEALRLNPGSSEARDGLDRARRAQRAEENVLQKK